MDLSKAVFASALAVVLVGSAGCGGGGAASGSARHPSGLEVVTGIEEPQVPDELGAAYGALDLLAESRPEDLGYVSVATDGETLVIGTVSEQGRDAVEAALHGQSSPAAEGATEGEAKLAASVAAGLEHLTGVDVVMVPAARSRAATVRIMDQAIDLSQLPELRDAGIWSARVAPSTGQVVVTMEHLTDAAAERLVRDFGAASVVVEIEANPQLVNPVGT